MSEDEYILEQVRGVGQDGELLTAPARSPRTAMIDELLAANPPQPESAQTVVSSDRKCARHQYVPIPIEDEDGKLLEVVTACARCGAIRDVARSRRGKSAARFGKDQERRIEKLYGPRKVGEFGDAIDLLGRDWKWQSKATRTAPPKWLVSVDAPVAHRPSALILGASEAMSALAPHLFPLVIRSYVDHRTRDWIWVRAVHWTALHGDAAGDPYLDWVVMSGIEFLTVNGRDEP